MIEIIGHIALFLLICSSFIGLLVIGSLIRTIADKGVFYIGNDPLECCEYYKKKGCAHVDGPLCKCDCEDKDV